MILTCPSCGTQYVVKDGAIPPEGRQVRCAACKHSWHQDPEAGAAAAGLNEPAAEGEAQSSEEAAPPEAPEAEPATADAGESLAEAALIEPRSGPEAEERAYEEAVIEGAADAEPAADAPEDEPAAAGAPVEDWREPPEAEAAPDMFSPFAAEDEEAPAKRRALTRLLIPLLVIIVLAVAFWLLAPANLKARLGLQALDATPLKIVTTHMDRQPLQSGNSLLTLTGRVINPSAKEQLVPPLRADLTTQDGKVVKSWTIPAPVPSLAPGASASFNSAEVNVPPGGEYLTITLGEKA